MSTPRLVRARLASRADPVDIAVTAEGIRVIGPPDPRAVPEVGGPACLVAEGFLDIQVNGFAAVDFNRQEVTVAELRRATEAM